MNFTKPQSRRLSGGCFAAAFCAFWLAFGVSTASAQSDFCGDVNGDGTISTVDALIILNYTIGVDIALNCPTFLDPETSGCGDVNGDGFVSPSDALILLRHAVGVPVDIHCTAISGARNLLRFFNALDCMGEPIVASLEVFPSGVTWSALTGEASPYLEWDNLSIGDTFFIDLGPCGVTELGGRIELVENQKYRIQLQRSKVFGTIQLPFIEEGPISPSD